MKKKLYVFLTNSIGGLSGGPSYVNNKTKWLKKHGWQVVAFDTTGYANLKIEYDDLKSFSENRFETLFFNPNQLNHIRVRHTIKKLLNIIGTYGVCDKIVIESNTLNTSLWGEMLAELIKAKHLIYLIGENVVINTNEFDDFYQYKTNREELFCISPQAYKKLFSKYALKSNPNNCYWPALSIVSPMKIIVPELEQLPSADFTIIHFGRYKEYFERMMDELVCFVQRNKNFSFRLIVVGENYDRHTTTKVDNLMIKMFKSFNPIPQAIFDMADVVIATAGCAQISYLANALTISMNVISHKPLGVLGYTTDQISFDSDIYDNNQSLSSLLNDVLITKKYENVKPTIDIFAKDGGVASYDYHLKWAYSPNEGYYDVNKVSHRNVGVKNIVLNILLRLGCVSLVSRMRYKLNK